MKLVYFSKAKKKFNQQIALKVKKEGMLMEGPPFREDLCPAVSCLDSIRCRYSLRDSSLNLPAHVFVDLGF